jgi:hypothetical protein
MKAFKWVVILWVAYVGIVVVFESLIGVIQPADESTLVITTTDAEGAHDRVLSRLESDGKIYVAANHWPRAWYERALSTPEVQATIGAETRSYTATPVEGAEYDRVDAEHSLPFLLRVLTGFPPRPLLRLDPRGD